MDNETAVVTETAADDLAGMTPVAEEPVAPGNRTKIAKAAGIGVTAVIIGAVGFTTLHSSNASTSAAQGPGGRGGPGGQGFQGGPPGQGGLGRGDRTAGSISAVSATSITLSTFQGATTTLKITSGTTVRVDGVASTVSALTVGDNAFITTSGTTAVQIDVNQGGFGGPPGGGPPPGAPTGTNGTTHT